jgi:hypothetical protein
MSRFLTSLQTERMRGDGLPPHRLIQSLQFASDVMCAIVIVPAGFRTDLGTVPRLPFAYMFFSGVGDEAAVVHDWLYYSEMAPRKIADEVFAEALKCMGVPAWQRGAMFLAVRTLGGSHYGKGSPVADIATEKPAPDEMD